MFSHKGIDYRKLTQDDVIGLTLFLSNVTKENELAGLLNHDIPLAARTIKKMLTDNKGVGIIALKDDIIVGAIILGYTTLWWSEKGFFTNLAYYVAPAFRKGLNIQEKLLEITKDFADGVNTPVLIDIFDKSEKHEKTSRFLSFKGFKNIGFKALYSPVKRE